MSIGKREPELADDEVDDGERDEDRLLSRQTGSQRLPSPSTDITGARSALPVPRSRSLAFKKRHETGCRPAKDRARERRDWSPDAADFGSV